MGNKENKEKKQVKTKKQTYNYKPTIKLVKDIKCKEISDTDFASY